MDYYNLFCDKGTTSSTSIPEIELQKSIKRNKTGINRLLEDLYIINIKLDNLEMKLNRIEKRLKTLENNHVEEAAEKLLEASEC